VVPLEEAPVVSGQHVLEIDLPGNEVVMLLADPTAPPTEEGQPLHVRPITRPQAAMLFDLIEHLDEPSTTVPPEADASPEPPLGSGPPHDGDGDTLYDPSLAVRFVRSSPPASLPVFDAPPSSDLENALPPPRITPRLSGPPAGSGVYPSYIVPAPSSLPAGSASAAPPSKGPASVPAASGTPPSGESTIGRVIASKYRIESLIGQGSTAAVFRATHVDLKRSVAVKILHQSNRSEMQFVKRFRAEALAASKLEHLNVTRVLDFGREPDGLLYLVMELLEGRSLESVLVAHTRLPADKAVEIAIQACTALAFAHDVGIIHRDVKPENIMLVGHRDDDGRPCDLVKVCDFGLAKLRDPDPEQGELTMAGMLCGSPAYMSPEQTRGEDLDPRTDVYSLGVTLFETLTGELPHNANALAELFVKKTLEPPRRPSAVRPDIDPLLDDIVLRAIATHRDKRHASARVLREELREALSSLEQPSSDDREGNTIVAD
jgi:eukaryotic-like serine/threonine-protein kinase